MGWDCKYRLLQEVYWSIGLLVPKVIVFLEVWQWLPSVNESLINKNL